MKVSIFRSIRSVVVVGVAAQLLQGVPQSLAGAAGDGYQRNSGFQLGSSEDLCRTSAELRPEWGCDETKKKIDQSRVSHQAALIGGKTAVDLKGARAASRAKEEGTHSSPFEAAADTARTTGQVSTGAGLLNLFHWGRLRKKARDHREQAEEAQAMKSVEVQVDPTSGVASAVSGGGKPAAVESTQKAIDQFKMNQAGSFNDAVAKKDPTTQEPMPTYNDPSRESKKTHVVELIGEVAGKVDGEQDEAEKAAKGQAAEALINGLAQLLQGLSAMETADQMEKAAEEVRDFETRAPVVQMPRLEPGNPMAPGNFGGMAPPAIIGSEPPTVDDDSSSAVEVADADDDEKPLPVGLPETGFGPLPTPAPQLAGDAGSTDAGFPQQVAGDGISGGAPEAPAQAGGSILSQERDPRYGGGGSGGGGAYAGGGRRGGGTGGGENDLSGMLEKLMAGRKGEVPEKARLEEFARTPASEGEYSFLDKSVNIFQRVHQAYQQKARNGRVALF